MRVWIEVVIKARRNYGLAKFVLVHGAGHEAVAVDLPGMGLDVAGLAGRLGVKDWVRAVLKDGQCAAEAGGGESMLEILPEPGGQRFWLGGERIVAQFYADCSDADVAFEMARLCS